MNPKASKEENKLVILFGLSGICGVIAMGVIIYIFRMMHWGNLSMGMMSLPWIISGIMLIPVAYRRGLKYGTDNLIANKPSERTR